MNAAAQKKYFTADEANQTLPLVRAIVGDIVDLYGDVHDRRERLAKIRQLPGSANRDDNSVYGEELQQIEIELDKDIERLKEFGEELRGLGVELKDPLVGLIDFPTLVDGREAYLCWRLGEDEIGFWHELDTGFSGRQSLYEGSVPSEEAADDETK
jgi:hypothetical protein